MTIEELAKQAGVDPTYLSYFERNADARLSAGTLLLLALALDTTPVDLQGGSLITPRGREGPATIRLSRHSRGSSVRLIYKRAEWDELCSPWERGPVGSRELRVHGWRRCRQHRCGQGHVS